MAWEDVKSARVRTAPVDGTTLTLGAGEHEFAFHAGEREFEYHPFPRDVTLVGAGPSKTLLRIRRAWRTTGPVVNFGFADMSIAIESSSVLESRTGDAVCLHFSNCRISAPDGIEFRNAGALWLDGCESDGTWGGRAKQAVVGKANDALVRFDRCVVTLCPPFESRNVLAVFLKGCTIREQGRAAETEGVNVRLVATTVDRLASWDDWRKRAAVPRQFTIDGDSKRRR